MAVPPSSGVDPLRLIITGLRTMLLILSLWELALSNVLPRLTVTPLSERMALPTDAPPSLLDMALNFHGDELRAASSALVGHGLLTTAVLLALSLLLLFLRVSWDASTPFGGPWQRFFDPYFQQQGQHGHRRASTLLLLLLPALPPPLRWFYGGEGGMEGGRGGKTPLWATAL